ncbi:Retrotrans gag domain-containing protein [Abeliophyllum distichum]|uniref:Retrotrans gag domain-containing protein n=1 Tax=Abeliophyllum distichum TaxID=126358 RepID=A0ABD1QA98_9LAMI
MMAQKIDDILSKKKDRRRQMVLVEYPFAPEIMAVLLPKGFKQLMIKAYDGVTNPLDHLQTFVDLMRPCTAPDAVMYQSLPSTLRKEARDYVATLALQSIKTFDKLSRSFIAYFLSHKRKRKVAIRLIQVVQEEDEGTKKGP